MQQVLQITLDARRTIKEARFIPAIRDRIARYTAQDFPTQLSLAARLAAALNAASSDQVGDEVNDPPAPEATYIAATSLRVSCALPYIASEADLDQWLAAVRAAAAAELKKGNRISL